jgi:hypothetical protein
MARTIRKYGMDWDAERFYDPLEIEMYCLRKGGRFTLKGIELGNGMMFHWKAAESLLWPEDDHHRWSDLFLENILAHKCIGGIGPANANKTYRLGKWILLDYWLFPTATLSIVSSTDVRGLELRVWGKIKELFNRGNEYRERVGSPDMPGNVLDGFKCITTDSLDEHDKKKKARVLTKGIICIPCMSNGKYVGLGKYAGAKQKRTRLAADEMQFMGPSHLDAYGNFVQSPGFKGIAIGNISLEPNDCLHRFCEPKEGWDNRPEPSKTDVWATKWMDGVAINFVGSDSPNFDYPDTEPIKYPYMVNRIGMQEVEAFYTKDSFQYLRDCIGVYRSSMMFNRFWTPEFCKQHRAHDLAIWDSTERTKVASIDAAYGGVGGDRCVFREGEFGLSHDNREILRVGKPELIPVSYKIKESPEDQIALWTFKRMMASSIPFNQLAYDSTGRGSLGASFAKLMGLVVPVPVEFGGRPSSRPVRHDLFVIDDKTGDKRLKRCDEQYWDMVSELWFSVKHMVHTEQMRELDLPTMREGCERVIGVWHGKKDFVESKHNPQDRKKMIVSPDQMDNLVTMVELARRLGFKIENLGAPVLVDNAPAGWLEKEASKYTGMLQKHMLSHR